MGNFWVFIILAAVCVGSAVCMLFSRNAIHAALFLVLNFTAVGVLYLVLNAPFIAMVQITVYAGAIMILFLFVIMLLGAERLEGLTDSANSGWQRFVAIILTILLIVAMITGVIDRAQGELGQQATVPPLDSSPAEIGRVLFENYVFPFELTSILLLVAMIAVVVWRTERKTTRKEEAA